MNCDCAYDGIFYYGVITTRIFCRPSCKSRIPNRGNVYIFENIDEALKSKFRPCKRCRPDRLRYPDEELARNTAQFIEENMHEPLTLETLARGLHVSPYHLHHVFKRIMKMTPADYLATARIHEAKRLLQKTDKSITEIAVLVGFTNTGHFSTVFAKRVGVNPTMYRLSNTEDGE